MNNVNDTLGLTEEFVFGTVAYRDVRTMKIVFAQGKFAIKTLDNGKIIVKKFNNRRGIGFYFCELRELKLWESGKRNTSPTDVDKTTYIGKCACGYKTRRLRDANVVNSTIDEHGLEKGHTTFDVEEVK